MLPLCIPRVVDIGASKKFQGMPSLDVLLVNH